MLIFSSRNFRVLSHYHPQYITRVSQRSVHAFSICKREIHTNWLPFLRLDRLKPKFLHPGYQTALTLSQWCSWWTKGAADLLISRLQLHALLRALVNHLQIITWCVFHSMCIHLRKNTRAYKSLHSNTGLVNVNDIQQSSFSSRRQSALLSRDIFNMSQGTYTGVRSCMSNLGQSVTLLSRNFAPLFFIVFQLI